MKSLPERIAHKATMALVPTLIGSLVARWFTDILAVITLESLLVAALAMVLPAYLWLTLRPRAGLENRGRAPTQLQVNAESLPVTGGTGGVLSRGSYSSAGLLQ